MANPVKRSRKTVIKKATAPAKKTTKIAKEEKAPVAVDLDSPSLYTNREISWIEFDRKVLETAEDRKEGTSTRDNRPHLSWKVYSVSSKTS